MRTLASSLSMCLALVLVTGSWTQEKKTPEKEKLVGMRELVKTTSSDGLLIGVKMEFTREGKFSAWLKGIDKPLNETTYEVRDGSIRWKSFKGTDNHEEMITRLTEKELVLVQKTAGDRTETHEFKRLK